jgi:hypothetical protein
MTDNITPEAVERLRNAFHKTRVGQHLNVLALDVGRILDDYDDLSARVAGLKAELQVALGQRDRARAERNEIRATLSGGTAKPAVDYPPPK